jgi:hypothetical protein
LFFSELEPVQKDKYQWKSAIGKLINLGQVIKAKTEIQKWKSAAGGDLKALDMIEQMEKKLLEMESVVALTNVEQMNVLLVKFEKKLKLSQEFQLPYYSKNGTKKNEFQVSHLDKCYEEFVKIECARDHLIRLSQQLKNPNRFLQGIATIDPTFPSTIIGFYSDNKSKKMCVLVQKDLKQHLTPKHLKELPDYFKDINTQVEQYREDFVTKVIAAKIAKGQKLPKKQNLIANEIQKRNAQK